MCREECVGGELLVRRKMEALVEVAELMWFRRSREAGASSVVFSTHDIQVVGMSFETKIRQP
jgi:hypothetical protein